MGGHTRQRRIAALGVLCSAAAGPLAGATVLLLADALGGVVKVPGDAVTYMALSGLALACVVLPVTLCLARRASPAGLAAVGGGLAALTLAVMGFVPHVPVFATGMMVAGVLASPLLTLSRGLAAGLHGSDVFAWWHGAALAGVAAAALLAVVRADAPGKALATAGLAAALLAIATICGAGQRVHEAPPLARVRDVTHTVGRALPAYATAGWAASVSVMAGLHLLVFRWSLVSGEAVERLGWACLPAVVVVAAARRLAGSVRTVPWLLLAAAAAPALMATAPGGTTLAIGFAVALAAVGLAMAALDEAILGGLPAEQRPAAAGLTAVVAVAGGLVGFGCAAFLRDVTGEGSALILMTLPLTVGALLALSISGQQFPPRPAPDYLEVRDRRITVHVAAGETVALYGPGARRLLSVLAGHMQPAGGKVMLGGADLTSMPAEQRTKLGLCHLISTTLPAEETRTLAEYLRIHARLLGRADPEATAKAVLEIFPSLRGDDPIGTLGEPDRGLLGLAAALVARPRLLLVAAQRPGPYTDGFAAALRCLAAEGTAVVLADPTAAIARRGYVLDRGRVIAEVTEPTPEKVHQLLRGGQAS